MAESTAHKEGLAGGIGAKLLRGLLVASALIWLLQGITGALLSYYFEINDSLISAAEPPKDLDKLQARMDAIEAQGGTINFIWSTAGLKDRYFLSYTTADGAGRSARIAGDGSVLLDTSEAGRTFLEGVRLVHLELASGKTGEWILTITGLLLLGYMLYNVYKLWPRRERWRDVLDPRRPAAGGSRLRSWYRALGLIGIVPGFVVVLAAVVIFFEHSIEGPIGAPPITLPAAKPESKGVGFAAAAKAAEAAIPGSRFVGTGMPTDDDATWSIWVNEPGEFFREQGYGGSLVKVDGNDGSVRGAWPLKDASAAYKAIALPYPVHTGEILGTFGRILVLLTGIWLAVVTVMGLILWHRGRSKEASA